MFLRLTIICFWVGIAEIQESSSQKIAQEKCKEFGEIYERPDDLLPGVIDKIVCNSRSISQQDRLAKIGEFPYMGTFKYITRERNTIYYCTGVLISEKYVITPAYCVLTEFGSPLAVRFGYMDVGNEDLGPYGQEIDIVNLKPHPDYSSKNRTDVIALIKLDKSVKFNRYVHPICLHTEEIMPGDVISSGLNYGTFSARGDGIYKKQFYKNIYKVYEDSRCREVYNITYNNKLICVGPKIFNPEKNEMQPRGTVQIINDKVRCMDSLIGISNYGRCNFCDVPDAYTKITPYIRWIESIVWE